MLNARGKIVDIPDNTFKFLEIIPFGERVDAPPQFASLRKKFDPLFAQVCQFARMTYILF
jgi:hypothetical protein